jgi:hypothetical protein
VNELQSCAGSSLTCGQTSCCNDEKDTGTVEGPGSRGVWKMDGHTLSNFVSFPWIVQLKAYLQYSFLVPFRISATGNGSRQ